MSFSIGTTSMGGGPRGLLRRLGQEDEEKGRAVDMRIIGRLLVFLKPHWRSMVGALFMMVISSGLGLLVPYLTKIAVDDYISSGDLGGLDRIVLITAGTFVGLYADI